MTIEIDINNIYEEIITHHPNLKDELKTFLNQLQMISVNEELIDVIYKRTISLMPQSTNFFDLNDINIKSKDSADVKSKINIKAYIILILIKKMNDEQLRKLFNEEHLRINLFMVEIKQFFDFFKN